MLEDWFMDIETTTDTVTERHTCLAEAKLCGLTHTLIPEAIQAGKCWNDIKDILSLKLWATAEWINMYPGTSHQAN